MSFEVIFQNRALDDIRKIIHSGQKSDVKKLYIILEELKLHPRSGVGNPEKLKHNLTLFWSRRINKKDRIIYQIIEQPDKFVVVVSALGHNR